MSQLQQQLTALSHANWSQQIQIIRGLPITPPIVKLITHRNFSTDLAALLISQHPRTQFVTVFTQYLIALFSANCNQLLTFANVLITSQCLIRLLGSGNRVVASSANELIKCIVSHTDFKEKAKQARYIRVLEDEYLTSKSSYVREKISLYFIYISTSMYYCSHEQLRQFQAKVVKVGLEDACEKVRKNMRQILENIGQLEKQNVLVAISNRSTSVSKVSRAKSKISGYEITKQGSNRKQLGPRVIYSSINHSSPLQAGNEKSIAESKVQLVSQTLGQELTYENFTFYLEQLYNGQSWAMVQIAYKSITEMLFRQGLSVINNDQLYCQCISTLAPFLSQKRGKMSESSCQLLCLIMQEIRQSSREKVISYVEEHCVGIIEQAAKTELVSCRLLPQIIECNPTLFLYRIAEVSTRLKVSKDKLLLLDTILKFIHLFANHSKSKKVPAIVKLICLHIRNSATREREIQLAALAIISQLRSKYHEDVLTALLCQDDRTLSKIIELAESIDESLKEAIMEYIRALKADRRSKPVIAKEGTTIKGRIAAEVRKIKQGKVVNLSKIGQLFLSNREELEQNESTQLLSVLEFLNNEELIIEYSIILEQLANCNNPGFTNALITAISLHVTHQHHQLLLMDVLAQSSSSLEIDQNEALVHSCCQTFADVYRNSKESLKLRSKAIECLTRFRRQMLEEVLTQNQLELVVAFWEKMEEEESQYF